ncbi:hypothetical protein Dimus_018448, partial [Dionaea muscipula]
RAQNVEDREKATQAEANLSADKLSAMEKQHLAALKKATDYKSMAEAAEGALKEKHSMIVGLQDGLKKLKDD